MNQKFREQDGFSLTELMTSLVVLALLTAIALPYFQEYQSSTFQERVKTDLKRVALAEESYFAKHQSYLSCVGKSCTSRLPGDPSISHGVSLQITATTSGFIGTATHEGLSIVCSWRSDSFGSQGCSKK